MRVRAYCLIGTLLGVVGACSGSEFTATDGSAGASSDAGSESGSSSYAGSSAVAGRANGGTPGSGGTHDGVAGEPGGGGDVSVGGSVGVGGSLGVGGDVSIAGSGGANMSGSAGTGTMLQCMDASTCPAPPPCQKAVCTAGMCGFKALPNGPFAQQVAGDCQQLTCEGGQKKAVVDVADSNDMNECTADSCGAGGVPTHTPLAGNNCANGAGFGSFEGVCATCNKAACPSSVSECTLPLCINGSCQQAPRPAGTLCNAQNDQCDGAGHCVDCWNSGGCGECCVCSAMHVCIPA